MGYPGVEITWEAATDDNWLSYYQVFRDGIAIDKVAKGTFYFDHSAGADLAAVYEIQAVDGAGNTSPKIIPTGWASKRCQIVDDTPGGTIRYTGQWIQKTGLQPAYARTITSSNQRGASAEITVEGSKVMVFVKLGPDCGKAAVRLDNGAPDIIDTYSADEIWGVGLYQRDLSAGKKHTLRIEVTGEHSESARDSVVNLDGIRVQTE